MTPQQNRTLHATLATLGLMAQKESFVFQFSNGKTKKSSEMDAVAANELLAWLRTQQPKEKPKLSPEQEKCQRMRRSIISMAWQMNWTYLNTKREVKCDVKRIDEWCAKYGYIKHEKLNDYTYSELPQLVSQFRNMCNSYINDI